jgi:hypothetical protein
MKLTKAQVQKYRSIRDTGIFEVDQIKTILVGPNEAGKTAVLQALQQINPPAGARKFDALRDYPRSDYNDITTGKIKAADVTVATAWFSLEDDDKAAIPEEYRGVTYVRGRRLDNEAWHDVNGGPSVPNFGNVKNDLLRLAGHADSRVTMPAAGQPVPDKPGAKLSAITKDWQEQMLLDGDQATAIDGWLDGVLTFVDESNATEVDRHKKLKSSAQLSQKRKQALEVLDKRLPVFVLFNNYFRVRPLIHLAHLAQRLETTEISVY